MSKIPPEGFEAVVEGSEFHSPASIAGLRKRDFGAETV
jgi:hypothetical protein